MGRAEQAFREAFERLKTETTVVLPKGSTVSQNNVAKEAGLDPTALKKARFPSLVAEIQHWISQRSAPTALSERQSMRRERKKNRTYKEQLNDVTKQRDAVASRLVEADAKILELTLELNSLRSTELPPNVKRIR
jgi:rRNA maturation endonuclease Nob1